MLKEKALEIARLNKQITGLLKEINKEKDDHRFYQCYENCFSWGSKQDVLDTAAALGVETTTKDRKGDRSFPTKTYFMYNGAEFYHLNEESEVVK